MTSFLILAALMGLLFSRSLFRAMGWSGNRSRERLQERRLRRETQRMERMAKQPRPHPRDESANH